jgi:hypothetical protein
MAEQSDQIKDLLRAGIAATENGDYAKGYKALGSFYGSGLDGLPPDGLSHYGLCVAVIEKQTRKGVEFCRAAMKAQFYQPIHFANLINLYIERDDRKNAVKVLEQGLRRMPDDPQLNRIRARIGYKVRIRPTIPFLARQNPVNVFLGRIRALFKK